MEMQERILIVEENEKNRKILAHFLSKLAIRTEEAASLSDAANQLLSPNNISLIFAHFISLDSRNLGLLCRIKSSNPRLSIVMLSEMKKPDMAIPLLEKEIIDYFVCRDNLAEIFSAIKNENRKKELIQKNEAYIQKLKRLKSEQQKTLNRVSDLEEVQDATLDNLMTALDLRDVETYGHSRTVAKYSQVLAQILDIKDKSSLNKIRKGSLLHDVGKIAIPDSILKKPAPLSPLEWEKVKLHPSLGFGLIKEIKTLKEVGNIILFHHERYDGTGYPRKLNKDQIPVEARIFALSDALDAITSNRPYREKRDFNFAKKEIQDNSGSQFDPKVVEAFCSISLNQWEKIRFETTRLMPVFDDMRKIRQMTQVNGKQ